MCFSTEASFGAGAILTVVGIATITKIQNRSQIPFAIIPMIFAFQQFTEGFVWRSLLDPNYLVHPQIPIYIFLIIAQIVWPFWIPFSVWCIEKDKDRKKILSVFIGVGVVFSLYIFFLMINHPPHAEIRHLHIRYVQEHSPILIIIGGVCYFMATVVTLFIPKDRKIKILGIIILTSFLISKLFFADNVVSVWCLFAAMMSFIIYFIIKKDPIQEQVE